MFAFGLSADCILSRSSLMLTDLVFSLFMLLVDAGSDLAAFSTVTF